MLVGTTEEELVSAVAIDIVQSERVEAERAAGRLHVDGWCEIDCRRFGFVLPVDARFAARVCVVRYWCDYDVRVM